jgi:hypothetical protein
MDKKHMQWWYALKTMFNKSWWTGPNTVEFFAFAMKIAIIFPGLLFGANIWWLYIFALISSAALVWSSTVKTMPTLVWFNIFWFILASLAILKHFGVLL